MFLDEIGELALTSQAKVLRCLETDDVRRVGDTHSHTVDVRLIAATNRNLRQAVVAGTFGGDLYYRLAIIAIDIPPLRDRPDDIPPLAEKMLAHTCAQTQSRADRLSAAVDALIGYGWPGNARQLDFCVWYAALLAGHGAIDPEYLPAELREPGAVRSDAPPLTWPNWNGGIFPR